MKSDNWIIFGILALIIWIAFKSGVLGVEDGGGGGAGAYRYTGEGLGDTITSLVGGGGLYTGQKYLTDGTSPIVAPIVAPIVTPIIPIDYPDKPRVSVLTPPSRDLPYEALLLSQPLAFQGVSWKSGATVQQRMRAGTFDPGIPSLPFVGSSGASIREGGGVGTGGVR